MTAVEMDNFKIYKLRKIPSESKYTVHPAAVYLKSNPTKDIAATESWKNRQNLISPEFSESNKQLVQKNDKNQQSITAQASVFIRDQNKSQLITEDPSLLPYILASDQSILSEQVDNWIRGSMVPTESAGIQFSRVPVVQRSTMATSSSYDPYGVGYILTLLLPLCSISNYLQWTCNSNNLINVAELILIQLRRYFSQVRIQIRRIAEDHLARDLFATLMEIVLVLYAMGFLVLYLYQAVALVQRS